MTPQSSAPPAGRIDFPVAIRGASAGFSVLLIGILLGAVITVRAPAAGFIFTVVAYCLAFFLAARKSGTATVPPLHGAFAASIAYVLVLPLILRDPAGRDIRQIALTLALSISIGAMTGWINAQARKSHV